MTTQAKGSENSGFDVATLGGERDVTHRLPPAQLCSNV